MSDTQGSRDGVLAPGERLGRYEIIGLLARGGMGAVYLARSAGAGGFSRLFAIKVMHAHLADEAEFVNMLVDEARVASRIHHPNAVAIIDLAESPQGYYLVMDYVEGATLTQVRTSKLLTDDQKTRIGLRMILDALAGLHAAHELHDDDGASLRIVHRDVSPHNILVGCDGVGRITDFGIALATARIASSRPGMIKGKPQYMAPEQVLASAVDRRADIFCAGIILWEFLTRGRLFRGDTEAAAMMMVCNAPIPAPTTLLPLPQGFDEVCLRALERDPDKRYRTARAFAEALEAVVDAAGWSMSTHDVSELVSTAFADDVAKRKALIRDRGRVAHEPVKEPASSRSAPMMQRPPRDSLAEAATVANPSTRPGEAPKETSASIPAIEVRPQQRKPAEVTTVRLSVVNDPPAKPARIIAAAAAATAIVVGVWWVGHRDAQNARESVSPTAHAATAPAASPTPAPAPPAPAAPTPPPAALAAPALAAPAPRGARTDRADDRRARARRALRAAARRRDRRASSPSRI
ncbi:MAG: serine/threonine-protein kinase [Polyangiales bacterium]